MPTQTSHNARKQIRWFENDSGGISATVWTKESGYVDLVVKGVRRRYSWAAYGWLGCEIFVKRGTFESENEARRDAVVWWKDMTGSRIAAPAPANVPSNGTFQLDGLDPLMAGASALQALSQSLSSVLRLSQPAPGRRPGMISETIKNAYLIGAPDALAETYKSLFDAHMDALDAGAGELEAAPAGHISTLTDALSLTIEAAAWKLTDELSGAHMSTRRLTESRPVGI